MLHMKATLGFVFLAPRYFSAADTPGRRCTAFCEHYDVRGWVLETN
jgi:hypothetical protein